MSGDRLTPGALRTMAAACRERARTGTIADFKSELMRLAEQYEHLAAELDLLRTSRFGAREADSPPGPVNGNPESRQ